VDYLMFDVVWLKVVLKDLNFLKDLKIIDAVVVVVVAAVVVDLEMVNEIVVVVEKDSD